MRKNRTKLEEHFCGVLTEYIKQEIDAEATVISEVTDKPDFAIAAGGRRIAVELSQFPSEYIIQYFHKKMPTPEYDGSKLVGNLVVYPFEPHRWVHEVIQKKERSAKSYKERVKADEIWLAMHCRSEKHEWPMSKRENERQRKFELELMRFGVGNRKTSFDKIVYLYADGTVVGLSGSGEPIPTAIQLDVGAGYPAVTTHQFGFGFDVPLPMLGERRFEFRDINFTEHMIEPKDDWMKERLPEIERPEFIVKGSSDSAEMRVDIQRNGISNLIEKVPTAMHIGRRLHFHTLLEWSIQPQKYSVKY